MMSADVFGRLCARVLISRLICSSPSPSLRVRLQLCFSLSSSPVQSSTVQYGPERSRTIRSQICPVCPSRFSSLLFAGPWWRSGPERALGCPRLERYLQGLRRISRDGPMTFSEPVLMCQSTVHPPTDLSYLLLSPPPHVPPCARTIRDGAVLSNVCRNVDAGGLEFARTNTRARPWG